MEDFLGSLFCFYILWGCCRVATACVYPCLNRRVHIAIRSKLLDHILLYRPIIVEEAKHLMGIEEIISYATLIPSAIYLWIRDGSFLFFGPDGIFISVWFTILFWCEFFYFCWIIGLDIFLYGVQKENSGHPV